MLGASQAPPSFPPPSPSTSNVLEVTYKWFCLGMSNGSHLITCEFSYQTYMQIHMFIYSFSYGTWSGKRFVLLINPVSRMFTNIVMNRLSQESWNSSVCESHLLLELIFSRPFLLKPQVLVTNLNLCLSSFHWTVHLVFWSPQDQKTVSLVLLFCKQSQFVWMCTKQVTIDLVLVWVGHSLNMSFDLSNLLVLQMKNM